MSKHKQPVPTVDRELVVFSRVRTLVPVTLESSLLGASIYTKAARGWTDRVRACGIFFDLSRVEWVDIGALLQVVLLIDSAVQNGIRVTVALPLLRSRSSEQQWVTTATTRFASEQVHRNIDRRAAARGFLVHLRFIEALTEQHQSGYKMPVILTDFDSSAQSNSDPQADTVQFDDTADETEILPMATTLYEYCFPLTWLTDVRSGEPKRMASFLSGVISHWQRGIARVDADAITNVMLYELVDNVLRHAGPGQRALATAWARPEHVPLHPANYLPAERPFIEWLKQSPAPLVEVIVGDSGAGIPARLGRSFKRARINQEILVPNGINDTSAALLWSFDRWSSSNDDTELARDRRGTRGLYRVDRVVSKYNGLISVRADNQMAGWDHGGLNHDAPIVSKDRMPLLPGTVLRLRMPSLPIERSVPRTKSGQGDPDLHLDIQSIGTVTSSGMTFEQRSKLRKVLGRARPDRALCVLAIIRGGDGPPKTSVANTLRQAVELRHPGTLVLFGLPGGWELVENECDSINSELERHHKHIESHKSDNFEVWNPVLVLGQNGNWIWVGANQQHRAILTGLLDANGDVVRQFKLKQLVPNDDQREAVLRHLRADSNLVRLEDDHSIRLRIALPMLYDGVARLLVDHVDSGRTGVAAGETFCTPSLVLVNKWIDVGRVLAVTCGPDLAMLALADRLRSHLAWDAAAPPDAILGDASADPGCLLSFSRLLGVDRAEPYHGEVVGLSRIRLVAPGTRVIVHADILASGESIRRCLSRVIRDGATPVAVTCVFNALDSDPDNIEIWRTKIPVIALAKLCIRPSGTYETPACINPITKTREAVPQSDRTEEAGYGIEDAQLSEILHRQPALHFSHIGHANGRHLTFFLDATRLADEPAISRKFQDSVSNWLSIRTERLPENAIRAGVEVWYPGHQPWAPARRFAEAIANYRSDVDFMLRPIRREELNGKWVFSSDPPDPLTYRDVVIVDWGALSAYSLLQMLRLASEAGADRVLVCIFLAQLPSDEEAFWRSVAMLRVRRHIPSGVSGPQQPLPLDLAIDKEHSEVEVSVRFLSRMAIGSYSPTECPVCQQLVLLAETSYPTALLREFASTQGERRLRLRTREEALRSPATDMHGRGLSGECTLWMMRTRQLLSEATASTSKRLDVRELLRDLLKERDGNSSVDPPSNQMLWFLHLLAVEASWLHQPPLHFEELRNLVADIAVRVALSSGVEAADRLHAVIVLRTASKFVFIERMEDLYSSLIPNDALVAQLLYSAFTLLNRPYQQPITILQPLADHLQAISQDPGSVTVAIRHTLDMLVARASSARQAAQLRPYTVQGIWRSLKGEFQSIDRHDPVTGNLLGLLLISDTHRLLATEHEDRSKLVLEMSLQLRTIEDNWSACRHFLDDHILPHLSQLSAILTTVDASNALGAESVQRLTKMISDRSLFGESLLSEVIGRVARASDDAANSDWDTFMRELRWLYEYILMPDENLVRCSRLVEYLRSAPSEIVSVLSSVYSEVFQHPAVSRGFEVEFVDEAWRTHGSVKVFCSRSLLRESCWQILANIVKHHVPGASPVRLQIDLTTVGGRARLTVRNNSTQPALRSGHGFDRVVPSLEAFGCRLWASNRSAVGWATYEASIDFPLAEDNNE